MQPAGLHSSPGSLGAWVLVGGVVLSMALAAVPMFAGGASPFLRGPASPLGFGVLPSIARPGGGCAPGCPGEGGSPSGSSPSPGPAGSGGTPAPSSGASGNGSAGATAPNGTLRIAGTSYWINYDSGGSYLGPTQQSLCLNCPILTTPNHEFALRFSLTNHDSIARHVDVGNGYVGCGVPFYLESVVLNISSTGEPFVLGPNQSVLVTAYIWPDSAGPGSWTYLGTIETY